MVFSLAVTMACSTDKNNTNSDSAEVSDTASNSVCPDDSTFFSETILPILNDRCAGCHNSSGVAGETQLLVI